MKLMSVVTEVLCTSCVVAGIFMMLVFSSKPAYAYVDPGAGLLFAQVIGSTLAGSLILVRKRIREFFKRFGRRMASQESDIAQS